MSGPGSQGAPDKRVHDWNMWGWTVSPDLHGHGMPPAESGREKSGVDGNGISLNSLIYIAIIMLFYEGEQEMRTV